MTTKCENCESTNLIWKTGFKKNTETKYPAFIPIYYCYCENCYHIIREKTLQQIENYLNGSIKIYNDPNIPSWEQDAVYDVFLNMEKIMKEKEKNKNNIELLNTNSGTLQDALATTLNNYLAKNVDSDEPITVGYVIGILEMLKLDFIESQTQDYD